MLDGEFRNSTSCHAYRTSIRRPLTPLGRLNLELSAVRRHLGSPVMIIERLRNFYDAQPFQPFVMHLVESLPAVGVVPPGH